MSGLKALLLSATLTLTAAGCAARATDNPVRDTATNVESSATPVNVDAATPTPTPSSLTTGAPVEAKRKRSIEMIDITGDAAVAKLVLDYPEVKFTDYMSLLKIEGEWKIVNKTFSAERRRRAN